MTVLIFLQAEWLPKPLCYIGELFSLITPTETYMLMSVVHNYLKVHNNIMLHVHVYYMHVTMEWSEHLQLKQEALDSIPGGCPGFFLFQLVYTNAYG